MLVAASTSILHAAPIKVLTGVVHFRGIDRDGAVLLRVRHLSPRVVQIATRAYFTRIFERLLVLECELPVTVHV